MFRYESFYVFLEFFSFRLIIFDYLIVFIGYVLEFFLVLFEIILFCLDFGGVLYSTFYRVGL